MSCRPVGVAWDIPPELPMNRKRSSKLWWCHELGSTAKNMIAAGSTDGAREYARTSAHIALSIIKRRKK